MVEPIKQEKRKKQSSSLLTEQPQDIPIHDKVAKLERRLADLEVRVAANEKNDISVMDCLYEDNQVHFLFTPQKRLTIAAYGDTIMTHFRTFAKDRTGAYKATDKGITLNL